MCLVIFVIFHQMKYLCGVATQSNIANSAKIISLLSHKETWALLRRMYTMVYNTMIPYSAPRINGLIEHISLY